MAEDNTQFIPDAGLASMYDIKSEMLEDLPSYNVVGEENLPPENQMPIPGTIGALQQGPLESFLRKNIGDYLGRVRERQAKLYGTDLLEETTPPQTVSENLMYTALSPEDLDMSALGDLVKFETRSAEDKRKAEEDAARDVRLAKMAGEGVGEGEGEGEGEGVDTGVGEGVGEGVDTDADRSAAQDLIDNLAGDKGDPKKLITDYKQEYMDLMPEYEGKTEFEKGMDLVKFGMFTAAGDSPNALKNITKGFLAMGDTFTKDAAEKREWERKVAISAASHVLNRRKEDRDTALQIGLKNAELLSDFDVAKLKQDAKDNKTAFDRALEFAKGTQITAKEATEQANIYGGYVDDYDTAIEGKELVAYMARAALGTKDEAGEVIGLGNWAKNQVNKAVNALTGGKHNTLEKFRSSAPEEYAKAQKRLAVKLADILLKESGKTISDRDRDLVKELVGGMVNEKGFVTADPEVLIESFRYIEKQMDNRIASSLRKMEALESGYIDKSVIGTGIYDPEQGAFVGGRMVVGDVFPRKRAGMIRDTGGVQRELFQDVPIDYRKELMKDGRILSIDEVMKARRQS